VHFDVERWQAFGGSWGSTLALAYAETHPERVSELVLRGIFLLRKKELDWFYQEGASFLYADRFEEYVAPIPPAERGDLVRAFHRRLTGANRAEAQAAARAWAVWEGATSYLLTDDDNVRKWGEDEFALAVARIECHYFVNGGFMKSESQLLDDIGRIRHIPAVIVQGRHDVVCPMFTAWDLHRAWPEAELRIVGDAGHSAFEPGITDELVRATDRFAQEKGDAHLFLKVTGTNQEKVSVTFFLALRDVDREPALRGLLVDRLHVVAGLAHGRDHLVERDLVGAVAAQRKPRRVDRLDRAHGVALDAGNLHEARDRVAGEAEVVFHPDLGGVLDLGVRAPERGREPGRRHRAGDADLALTAHLGAGDRGIALVEKSDRASGEQELLDAGGVAPGQSLA
jgi:proline iminopeptidase